MFISYHVDFLTGNIGNRELRIHGGSEIVIDSNFRIVVIRIANHPALNSA